MKQNDARRTDDDDNVSKARSYMGYWGTAPSESLRGVMGRN